MKVDLVVDIGNSRIKWARCVGDGLGPLAALPPDQPETWQRQLDAWELAGPRTWGLSGVHPLVGQLLAEWLRERGHNVVVLEKAQQLPLRVTLPRPDQVGIDRLLNAVAANRRRSPEQPAVIVDAGSAVTVDWVDENGAFRGGTIFPGLRLMAKALHDYTALLPVVEVNRPLPSVLGTSTPTAIEAGIYFAVAGGVNHLVARLAEQGPTEPAVFLTGGDAAILQPAVDRRAVLWPEMTLEGVRLSLEPAP